MNASRASPGRQRLRGIEGFRLVTSDLSRLVAFYRDVLGFAVHGEVKLIAREEMDLLGLQGGGRRQGLSIGSQIVAIDEFEIEGRSYPPDCNAASLWFQHLALVVVDIAEAHVRLRDIAPISIAGPQQLPASSGGVQAFKFRDPDGHPLELLQFPRNHMPATWKDRSPARGQIALGVDHSAISVRDAEASEAFYSALGLTPGKRSVNQGPAQQRLDDLRDVEVSVTPMMPESNAPHLELLGYQTHGPGVARELHPNDVAATRILWLGEGPQLLHDPDGHFHQIARQDGRLD